MIPATYRNLAGTLPEQIAHLGMHLAGETCPTHSLPKTGVRRHVYERDTAEPREPVKRFPPNKDRRGERPEGISDRDWAAAHSVQAQRIYAALKSAGRPVQTNELLVLVAISRSYMLRILTAMVLAGRIRQIGKGGTGNLLKWGAVP